MTSAPESGRKDREEEAIVQAEETERDREQVEEGVVAGEGDGRHEGGEYQRGVVAQGARREDEKWHEQLDGEHPGAGSAMPPRRQLVRIPAEDRGQRLGFIMEAECAEIAPVRIAAGQLHDASQKH